MKKLSILLSMIFIFSTCAFAQDNISFVYINGSNNNSEKAAGWFEKRVKNFHPVLREKFLTNETIQKYSQIESTSFDIKKEPVIFFWGYKSKQGLDFLKDELELSKAVSSSGAYIARSLFTQCMHDAVWVQKPEHMITLLDNLNETVKNEAKDGNYVVLYGYSAGTFITYEYLLRNLRYINLYDLFKALDMDKEFLDFVKDNPREDTCISAIIETHGNLATISQSGRFILNGNSKQLKENYLKIDEHTEAACAPKDKVLGVINFASPLPLFYSNLADEEYDVNYSNVYMVKHILEHQMFFITVNFREDFLGIPTNNNVKIDEIEKALNIKINNPQGIIYDNSSVWSGRPFPLAHTAYLSAKKTFARAIVKTFTDAYKFQYGE